VGVVGAAREIGQISESRRASSSRLSLHGFAHSIIRREDFDDHQRCVQHDAVGLLERASHHQDIGHTIPSSLDARPAYRADCQTELLFECRKMNDQNPQQGTVRRCSHIALDN
jgi:hypothetical protein